MGRQTKPVLERLTIEEVDLPIFTKMKSPITLITIHSLEAARPSTKSHFTSAYMIIIRCTIPSTCLEAAHLGAQAPQPSTPKNKAIFTILIKIERRHARSTPSPPATASSALPIVRSPIPLALPPSGIPSPAERPSSDGLPLALLILSKA
ncbi:N-glycanase 1 [Corchorus olitorius]|uniref:N-glycanase 1 n=1 Tax=Corchorus olitorius TaxID=93759 RepID=A0A1R3KMN3_9ROSI|nr:N-glycanase 1 [Corchorus olitorius]